MARACRGERRRIVIWSASPIAGNAAGQSSRAHGGIRPSPALTSPGSRTRQGSPTDTYDAWLADFRHRLAQHDAGVAALARDLASRTPWTVHAVGSDEFTPPPPAAGLPPDVLCERGRDTRPMVFEVELPETLVRRATVTRLSALVTSGMEPRIVLVGAPDKHERQIAETRRLLRRAGLPLEVAAIAPDEETITGADW